MTIELKPEIEAGLQDEARARGTSVEAFVEEVLARYARKEAIPDDPQEWINKLREWALSHPPMPHLSDEAVRRESFYGDRG